MGISVSVFEGIGIFDLFSCKQTGLYHNFIESRCFMLFSYFERFTFCLRRLGPDHCFPARLVKWHRGCWVRSCLRRLEPTGAHVKWMQKKLGKPRSRHGAVFWGLGILCWRLDETWGFRISFGLGSF